MSGSTGLRRKVLLIGTRMIGDAVKKRPGKKIKCEIGYKKLILLSIATSIDALAVGLTFSLLEVSIVQPVIIIGVVTFFI